MYIGKRLKEFRISKELNQSEFSEKLGVSQPYYSSIESSKKPATKKFLKKMEEVWGSKKEYFEADPKENLGVEDGGLSGGVPIFVTQKHQKRMEKIYNSGLQTMNSANRLVDDIKKTQPDLYRLFQSINTLVHFESFVASLDFWYLQNVGAQLLNTEKFRDNRSFKYKEYKDNFIKTLTPIKSIEEPLLEMQQAINKFYADVKDFDYSGNLDFPDSDEELISEGEKPE